VVAIQLQYFFSNIFPAFWDLIFFRSPIICVASTCYLFIYSFT